VKSGAFIAATQDAKAVATDIDSGKNDLLYAMEAGLILRIGGHLQESQEAFDAADQMLRSNELKSNISLSEETTSYLTTPNALTYRGYGYEKILLNTYKALNTIEMGKWDAARVELNRSLQQQRNAVADNARAIEKAQEMSQQAKRGKLRPSSFMNNGVRDSDMRFDADAAARDGRVSTAAQQALAGVPSSANAFSDYVNPFSVFLDGLFFMVNPADSSDLERARKSMERVATMIPDNPFAQQDFALATQRANGAPMPDLTYILFETGQAPSKDEVIFDFPLFLVSNKLSYIGAAFPRLVANDFYVRNCSVRTNDGSTTSALLADMDAIVGADFKNRWPATLNRALISSAIKALVGYTIERIGEEQGGAHGKLLGMVASIAYQASTNHADLRTWELLPKQFQYIRIPTPTDGILTLFVDGREYSVNITPHTVNLIHVRSIRPGIPSIIRHSTF
jgi:hypothetical protein